LEALEHAIKAAPNCRLVIVDPVSAYLGSTESHTNAAVLGVLAPLAELAAKYGVAVLVITHLRKGEGPALYRAMGSLAFVAAARAVWAVARDSDDLTGRRRLFLPVNNPRQRHRRPRL
jgi:putative DNA primase/helicase